MDNGDVLLIKERDITSVLTGREHDVMRAVEAAYLAHANQESSLPHSTFLTFPNSSINRIIGLPAYLGGGFDIAGMKWVSSFPGNRELGLNRASAVIVLNSVTTGRAEALMEGSVISAKRTAASAVLAARHLFAGDPAAGVGFIGCGLINREVLRFLVAAYPSMRKLLLHDHTRERCNEFAAACLGFAPDIEVTICDDSKDVFAGAGLVSIATTALKPHIHSLAGSPKGQVVLHISLRDITSDVILESDNIVDDIDHVCRANTSIHLAEQSIGNRNFIRGTIADILSRDAPAKSNADAVTIVSPFGLGVLDLAVAKLVRDTALEHGLGITVDSFFA